MTDFYDSNDSSDEEEDDIQKDNSCENFRTISFVYNYDHKATN